RLGPCRPTLGYGVTIARSGQESLPAGPQSGGFQASAPGRWRGYLQIDSGLLDLVPDSSSKWFPDRDQAKVRANEGLALVYQPPVSVPRGHSRQGKAASRLEDRTGPLQDYKHQTQQSDPRPRCLPVRAQYSPVCRLPLASWSDR